MYFEVAISLFLTWFLWYIFTSYKERSQMPPGPIPLPFIGNLHNMGYDPIVTFEKLRKKYGDVFTLSFPNDNIVVVNNADLVQEVLLTRKDDMAGRLPRLIYPLDIVLEGLDIASADYGPTWLFRRKVFKSALHVFGSGLNEAEERASHAVENLLEEIEAMQDKPFSPKDYIASAIISELWKWLTSKQCSSNHPTVKSLLEFNRLVPVIVSQATLYRLAPWFGYLPSTFKENLRNIITIRDETFSSELETHRRNYKPGIIRDLTDSFLSAYENEIAKESGKDIGSIEAVKGLMINVIVGGADTSSSVISWFILHMILNQDIQKKIHDELDKVVGTDRMPCREDVNNLHLLQASICEVMRLSPLLPISIRSAIRDTSIQGYKIPKDTTIFINTVALQHDPNHWSEVKIYKPERFLDADGKFVGWTKFPAFLPFLIGHRQCPGMSLAKIQLFSMVSTLLHRFKFEPVQNEPKPTLEYDTSNAIIRPKDYKVVARLRV